MVAPISTKSTFYMVSVNCDFLNKPYCYETAVKSGVSFMQLVCAMIVAFLSALLWIWSQYTGCAMHRMNEFMLIRQSFLNLVSIMASSDSIVKSFSSASKESVMIGDPFSNLRGMLSHFFSCSHCASVMPTKRIRSFTVFVSSCLSRLAAESPRFLSSPLKFIDVFDERRDDSLRIISTPPLPTF